MYIPYEVGLCSFTTCTIEPTNIEETQDEALFVDCKVFENGVATKDVVLMYIEPEL